MIDLYPPNTKRISAKAYRKMLIIKALDKMNTKQIIKVVEFIENEELRKCGYGKLLDVVAQSKKLRGKTK